MNSIIAIGDVHGLTYWKTIVEKKTKSRIVFLGDYLDPYESFSIDQLLENLLDIIILKKQRPKDVVLLLGNHDLHYFNDIIGFSCRYNDRYSRLIMKIFFTHIKLFQYAFQMDKYIFTHAGISQSWFTDDFKGDINKNIADQLNNPTPQQEKALYLCGKSRGGSAKRGGIFWAGINDLYEPLQGYIQVVGHNRVEEVSNYTYKDGQIIFCDCLF